MWAFLEFSCTDFPVSNKSGKQDITQSDLDPAHILLS